jgi:hypothetical protein
LSVRRFDAVLRSQIEVGSKNCGDALPYGFVIVGYQYSHFVGRFGPSIQPSPITWQAWNYHSGVQD